MNEGLKDAVKVGVLACMASAALITGIVSAAKIISTDNGDFTVKSTAGDFRVVQVVHWSGDHIDTTDAGGVVREFHGTFTVIENKGPEK
jgi:hypothetical protein